MVLDALRRGVAGGSRLLLAGGAVFLALGVESADAQGRSSTVPFGYLKKALKGKGTNDGLELIGAPFVNQTEYQGVVAGGEGSQLEDEHATKGMRDRVRVRIAGV